MLFNLLQKVYQTKIKLFLCLLCLSCKSLCALPEGESGMTITEALTTLGFSTAEMEGLIGLNGEEIISKVREKIPDDHKKMSPKAVFALDFIVDLYHSKALEGEVNRHCADNALISSSLEGWSAAMDEITPERLAEIMTIRGALATLRFTKAEQQTLAKLNDDEQIMARIMDIVYSKNYTSNQRELVEATIAISYLAQLFENRELAEDLNLHVSMSIVRALNILGIDNTTINTSSYPQLRDKIASSIAAITNNPTDTYEKTTKFALNYLFWQDEQGNLASLISNLINRSHDHRGSPYKTLAKEVTPFPPHRSGANLKRPAALLLPGSRNATRRFSSGMPIQPLHKSNGCASSPSEQQMPPSFDGLCIWKALHILGVYDIEALKRLDSDEDILMIIRNTIEANSYEENTFAYQTPEAALATAFIQTHYNNGTLAKAIQNITPAYESKCIQAALAALGIDVRTLTTQDERTIRYIVSRQITQVVQETIFNRTVFPQKALLALDFITNLTEREGWPYLCTRISPHSRHARLCDRYRPKLSPIAQFYYKLPRPLKRVVGAAVVVIFAGLHYWRQAKQGRP